MIARLISAEGKEYTLPPLHSCVLKLTPNVPCSAFRLSCPYEKELLPKLEGAAYCRIFHEGATVFYGIVDDFEIRQGASGRSVTISGRGLAALLIDNQAEAAEFVLATLSDVLQRYVLPYGIRNIVSGQLLPVSNLVIPGGSSLWEALCAFTQASRGITPRFSKDGMLIIINDGGALRRVSEGSGVLSLQYLKKRYGILSEVIVKRSDGFSVSVKNEEFILAGGRRRRIITVPSSVNEYQMLQLGRSRIDASKAKKCAVSLNLAGLIFADGGDIVDLNLPKHGITGKFLVSETTVHYGACPRTTLELVKE